MRNSFLKYEEIFPHISQDIYVTMPLLYLFSYSVWLIG